MGFFIQTYAALLRVPVFGPLAGFVVRTIKRMFGISTIDQRPTISMMGVAMGGFRSRIDDLNQRVSDLDPLLERVNMLEKKLAEQQMLVEQLADYIEIMERSTKKNGAAPTQVSPS